jgi:2-(1,2-epoxy-1,2-dihydrophenyl)acetyl-CoA isomerase
MSDENSILFNEESGVAWITLNRPEKLNSFNEAMAAQLQSAIQKIQTSNSIRCVVITGAGRAFSAGQDLEGLEGVDLGQVVDRDYNVVVRYLKGLNLPVIASVNGVAAGAAANLALACDIVIAANSAKFIQPFVNLSLVPDAGGTWSLPRLIGLPRAMGLMLTAEPIDAKTAQEWGMIWKAVDDDALEDETLALAHKLANLPTTGIAFTKQLLHMSSTKTLDEQLDMERDFQQAACQTSDYQEGVDAFLNKRKPHFTGK